jgi:SNF2 family DNA or RNA helicase
MILMAEVESKILASALSKEQEESLSLLVKSREFLLCLGVGMGKSLTILSAFDQVYQKDQGYHLVVTCPVNAIKTWKSELLKWTKYKSNIYLSKDSDKFDCSGGDIEGEVSVFSFTSLEKFPELLKKLFTDRKIVLVCDEIQVVKNPKSMVGKVVRYLRNHSTYFWGATGTPLTNHIESLWEVFDLVKPGYLGRLQEFLDQYTIRERKEIVQRLAYTPKLVKNPTTGRLCVPKYFGPVPVLLEAWNRSGVWYIKNQIQVIIGYKNETELSEKLKPYMIMRSRQVKTNFKYLTAPISPDEERLYLKAAQGILGTDYREFVSRLSHLQEAADNSVVEGGGRNITPSLSSKERLFLDTVIGLLRKGKCPIVYSSLIMTIGRLRFILTPLKARIFEITGASSAKQRGAVVDEFKSGDILLLSSAGSVSLNLKQSDTIVFYSLPFEISTLCQVIGRVTRYDSSFSEFDLIFILLGGTIDEYKEQYLRQSASVVEKFLGGYANLPKEGGVTTKKMLIEMRKSLLWRIKKGGGEEKKSNWGTV